MFTRPVESMRIGGITGIIVWLSLVAVTQAARMDRYVREVNAGAEPPFTSWAMAATDLKTAVDCANTNNAGDNVIVSNGAYLLTATVNVTNVVVTSFSGDRTRVIVNGNSPTYSNRCFYLNHANARLVGLTITNGCTTTNSLSGQGGGIYLAAGGVSNCVIAGNQAWIKSADYQHGGGGVYITGGGEVSDCLISGNTVYTCPDANDASGGGGAYVKNGRLRRSQVMYNVATNRNGSGGGVFIDSTNASVDQCDITSNTASTTPVGYKGGGGVYMYYGGFMSNCVIKANTAVTAQVGIV